MIEMLDLFVGLRLVTRSEAHGYTQLFHESSLNTGGNCGLWSLIMSSVIP